MEVINAARVAWRSDFVEERAGIVVLFHNEEPRADIAVELSNLVAVLESSTRCLEVFRLSADRKVIHVVAVQTEFDVVVLSRFWIFLYDWDDEVWIHENSSFLLFAGARTMYRMHIMPNIAALGLVLNGEAREEEILKKDPRHEDHLLI